MSYPPQNLLLYNYKFSIVLGHGGTADDSGVVRGRPQSIRLKQPLLSRTAGLRFQPSVTSNVAFRFLFWWMQPDSCNLENDHDEQVLPRLRPHHFT